MMPDLWGDRIRAIRDRSRTALRLGEPTRNRTSRVPIEPLPERLRGSEWVLWEVSTAQARRRRVNDSGWIEDAE